MGRPGAGFIAYDVDEGLVTVTKDFRIWYVDPNLKDGPYSQYDLLLSANFYGQAMKMPIASPMRPALAYLERGHELHEWQQHLPA